MKYYIEHDLFINLVIVTGSIIGVLFIIIIKYYVTKRKNKKAKKLHDLQGRNSTVKMHIERPTPSQYNDWEEFINSKTK